MSDTITTEVIRHALLAAAEEVARNLCRTSYNTVVYEIHDYGIGIHDVNGDVIADAPGIAIFRGATTPASSTRSTSSASRRWGRATSSS